MTGMKLLKSCTPGGTLLTLLLLLTATPPADYAATLRECRPLAK
ncbi:MAG: hypothetical protein M2R45_02355 [Verrucomicrobia subdivision 3 bacterium]|nr:hypothetical protein [Limisphaerales bacterium]MCS1414906.1 hypothetical protein [Limisphaerales bacterium]